MPTLIKIIIKKLTNYTQNSLVILYIKFYYKIYKKIS